MSSKWAAFLSMLLLLPVAPAWAEEFQAKVISVTDGDTIKVLHNGIPEKIRLAGIDAPEHNQAFGQSAKQFTANLVFWKTVAVKSSGHDRYGRTIADIRLQDGTDLNKELVKAGLAWWYRKYAPHDNQLSQLEEQARENNVGLWSSSDSLPPWEFRHHQRQ